MVSCHVMNTQTDESPRLSSVIAIVVSRRECDVMCNVSFSLTAHVSTCVLSVKGDVLPSLVPLFTHSNRHRISLTTMTLN